MVVDRGAGGARDRAVILDADLAIDRDVYLSSMSWRAQARCRNVPTEMFVARRGDELSVRAAKRICRGCPVRAECLDYALAAGERFGVWGGVSERRRRELCTSR